MFSTLVLNYAENKEPEDVNGEQYFVADLDSLCLSPASIMDEEFITENPTVEGCHDFRFYLVTKNNEELDYVGKLHLALYPEVDDNEKNFLQKLIIPHHEDNIVMSKLSIEIKSVGKVQSKRSRLSLCDFKFGEKANILIMQNVDEEFVVEYLHSYFDYDRIKKEKADVRSKIHAL